MDFSLLILNNFTFFVGAILLYLIFLLTKREQSFKKRIAAFLWVVSGLFPYGVAYAEYNLMHPFGLTLQPWMSGAAIGIWIAVLIVFRKYTFPFRRTCANCGKKLSFLQMLYTETCEDDENKG